MNTQINAASFALDKLKSYSRIKKEILSDNSWGNASDRSLKQSEIDSLDYVIKLVENYHSDESRIADLESILAGNTNYEQQLSLEYTVRHLESQNAKLRGALEEISEIRVTYGNVRYAYGEIKQLVQQALNSKEG